MCIVSVIFGNNVSFYLCSFLKYKKLTLKLCPSVWTQPYHTNHSTPKIIKTPLMCDIIDQK